MQCDGGTGYLEDEDFAADYHCPAASLSDCSKPCMYVFVRIDVAFFDIVSSPRFKCPFLLKTVKTVL